MKLKSIKIPMLTTVLIFVLISLLSCTGDMGEVGPQGEAGLQGLPGVQGVQGEQEINRVAPCDSATDVTGVTGVTTFSEGKGMGIPSQKLHVILFMPQGFNWALQAGGQRLEFIVTHNLLDKVSL
jgi:hypothetical protein